MTENYRLLDIPKMGDGTYPVLRIKDGDVAPTIVICGPNTRLEEMRERMTEAQRVGVEPGRDKRSYRVYTGIYKGKPLTIASHLMGCPSIAMAVEELIAAGGKNIIRAGGCAAISPNVKTGDLIIVTGAVRDDGTSPYYAPQIYPAVADHRVVSALCQSAEALDAPHHVGIIRTTDSLYQGEEKADIIEKWLNCNVLAFEMEISALFTIASVMGCRSGALLTTATNLVTEDGAFVSEGEKMKGEELAISIVLDAAISLETED
jgi:uridine phosphorylase